jgi:hypothetical protein
MKKTQVNTQPFLKNPIFLVKTYPLEHNLVYTRVKNTTQDNPGLLPTPLPLPICKCIFEQSQNKKSCSCALSISLSVYV